MASFSAFPGEVHPCRQPTLILPSPIDFEKGAGDPRRIFDAASMLVDAFEAVDDAIIGVVDSKIQTLMVLEDVEAGWRVGKRNADTTLEFRTGKKPQYFGHLTNDIVYSRPTQKARVRSRCPIRGRRGFRPDANKAVVIQYAGVAARTGS